MDSINEEFTSFEDMDNEFDFDCPQYTDFSQADGVDEDDNADGYFAVRRSSVGLEGFPHPSMRKGLRTHKENETENPNELIEPMKNVSIQHENQPVTSTQCENAAHPNRNEMNGTSQNEMNPLNVPEEEVSSPFADSPSENSPEELAYNTQSPLHPFQRPMADVTNNIEALQYMVERNGQICGGEETNEDTAKPAPNNTMEEEEEDIHVGASIKSPLSNENQFPLPNPPTPPFPPQMNKISTPPLEFLDEIQESEVTVDEYYGDEEIIACQEDQLGEIIEEEEQEMMEGYSEREEPYQPQQSVFHPTQGEVVEGGECVSEDQQASEIMQGQEIIREDCEMEREDREVTQQYDETTPEEHEMKLQDHELTQQYDETTPEDHGIEPQDREFTQQYDETTPEEHEMEPKELEFIQQNGESTPEFTSKDVENKPPKMTENQLDNVANEMKKSIIHQETESEMLNDGETSFENDIPLRTKNRVATPGIVHVDTPPMPEDTSPGAFLRDEEDETSNEPTYIKPISLEGKFRSASDSNVSPRSNDEQKPKRPSSTRGRRTPTYLNGTKSSQSRHRSSSPSLQGRRRDSKAHQAKASVVHSKLTLTEPQTPAFTARTRRREPLKSSTTLELQKIRDERKQMQLKREQDKIQLQRIQENTCKEDANSTGTEKSITRPQGPNLASSARPGALRAERLRVNDRKEATTAKETKVKKSRSSTGSYKKPATKTEPFHFASDKRIKSRSSLGSTQSNSYVPLAAQVQQFQSKTPMRFRMKSSDKIAKTKNEPLHLTEPQAPRLATQVRANATKQSHVVKSTAQKEEEEMLKIKKFKARKINKKIMESSGDLGVPKVQKKPTCQPKEFVLHTDKRASMRPSISSTKLANGSNENRSNASVSSFGKRSFNSTKAKRLSSSPPKPTVVEPFRFMTDARAQHNHGVTKENAEAFRLKEEEKEAKRLAEAKKKIKARKMPDFSQPVVAPLERKQPTIPEPFNLISVQKHEQCQEAKRHEMEKLRMEEEEQRQFKARRVPHYPVTPDPKPSERPLTDPITPAVLQRSQMAEAEFFLKQRQKEAEESENVKFVAKGIPETTFRPNFTVQRGLQELTKPIEVQLNSDKRAEERYMFDQKVNQHMEELALRKQQEDRAKKMQEDRELKQLRASMVPKARSVPKSLKEPHNLAKHLMKQELTDPHSPFLMTKLRGQSKMNGENDM